MMFKYQYNFHHFENANKRKDTKVSKDFICHVVNLSLIHKKWANVNTQTTL